MSSFRASWSCRFVSQEAKSSHDGDQVSLRRSGSCFQVRLAAVLMATGDTSPPPAFCESGPLGAGRRRGNLRVMSNVVVRARQFPLTENDEIDPGQGQVHLSKARKHIVMIEPNDA